MTITAYTPCGTAFTVSDCDVDLLINPEVPWRLSEHGYVKQTSPHRYLHRAVMRRVVGRPLRSSEPVDHINGIRTDCTRENLRQVTHLQNVLNRHNRPKGAVGHWGVAEIKASGNFRAYIVSEDKQQHIGTYATAEEAAMAYNIAARTLWGDDAPQNDVDPSIVPQPITHAPSATGLPAGIRPAPGGRYYARMKYRGEEYHLGVHDTLQEAQEARRVRAEELELLERLNVRG